MSMIEGRDAEFVQTVTALYRQELGRDPDPGGLENWVNNCRHGMTGPELQRGFHDSPEGIAFRARPVVVAPPPVTVPHLEVRGLDLVDATGARQVLCGCDAFTAFRLFLDGDLEVLDALFEESRALGFNLWRVFLMGSVRQNQILQLSPAEPGYYHALPDFAEVLNRHGLVLLATVFVDAQDIMPHPGDRAEHWWEVARALGGTATILSGGNQYSKNGFDPTSLTTPGLPLWSRGSDVGDRVTQPHGASVQEFHPRRDLPAMLMDTVASAVYIYQQGPDWQRPLLITEPIGFAETPRVNSRSSDPRLAWELARLYATKCAGAVFHSDAGMRGQLLGPVQRACAEAWQRGMRI